MYKNAGCKIGGYVVNMLAYTDDIVLLAPSWRGLQKVLTILKGQAINGEI